MLGRESGQRAGRRVVGWSTTGLVAGWFLAVARVRRSSRRAWIWRCAAAGLKEACWAARRRRRSGLTAGWVMARA
jgi:hypothetical protein